MKKNMFLSSVTFLAIIFASGCYGNSSSCDDDCNTNNTTPNPVTSIEIGGPQRLSGISWESDPSGNDFFAGRDVRYDLVVGDGPAIYVIVFEDEGRITANRSFEIYVPTSASIMESWIARNLAGPTFSDPLLLPTHSSEVDDLELFAKAGACGLLGTRHSDGSVTSPVTFGCPATAYDDIFAMPARPDGDKVFFRSMPGMLHVIYVVFR